MIDRLSAATAKVIKRNAPDHPASEAVLKYALEGAYNVLFIVLLTVAVSIWTGRLSESVISMLAFAVLRQITGGVHLKSGVACVIVSTSLFTILSLVHPSKTFLLIMSIISLILVLLFAPSRIERQSRIPKKHYPYLKAAGAALITAGYFIGNDMIILSFFIQSITLIRLKGGEQHD